MPHSHRAPSAYVFVGSPAEFGGALPFRLSSRMVLRQAKASEIASIKKYLNELSTEFPCTQIFESIFKSEVKSIDKVECVYHKPTVLPQEQWRYHVIAVTRFQGNPFDEDFSDLILLRISSQLSTCPLFLNTASFIRTWHSLDFAADWHHYTNPTDAEYKTANYQRYELEDWQSILQLVDQAKSSFPYVWHSLKLFSEIPIVKGHNKLTILALFSVLESVLTHNPRGEFDSIGHQIGAKIALISKRVDLKLDYSVFGNTSPETIWKKLYDLRSRIAHGSQVSFSGPFQVLDDVYTVERFMFTTLRSILRFAVKEPQLVTDLKSI